MSECKCGNCGGPLSVSPTTPDDPHEWLECQVCERLETKAGHFARRLERVEAMARAIAGSVWNEGGVCCIMLSSTDLVTEAAKRVDELDAWAQGGGR